MSLPGVYYDPENLQETNTQITLWQSDGTSETNNPASSLSLYFDFCDGLSGVYMYVWVIGFVKESDLLDANGDPNLNTAFKLISGDISQNALQVEASPNRITKIVVMYVDPSDATGVSPYVRYAFTGRHVSAGAL